MVSDGCQDQEIAGPLGSLVLPAERGRLGTPPHRRSFRGARRAYIRRPIGAALELHIFTSGRTTIATGRRNSFGFGGVTRCEYPPCIRIALLDRDGNRIRREAIRGQNHFDLTTSGQGATQRSEDDSIETRLGRVWCSGADFNVRIANCSLQPLLPPPDACTEQPQVQLVGLRSEA